MVLSADLRLGTYLSLILSFNIDGSVLDSVLLLFLSVQASITLEERDSHQ